MQLLFANYEFPPVGGGAAYASQATARELVAMGHQVDFLTAATDGKCRLHHLVAKHFTDLSLESDCYRSVSTRDYG